MKLAVLNPGGRDHEQAYPDFAGGPDDRAAHPPVNYHAYAACTGGTFYRDPERIPASRCDVLLVLRRDLKQCLSALRKLKAQEKCVAVSLKESGFHQMADLLSEGDNLRRFREICALADGCLASTPDLEGVYHSAGAARVRFIPTPYPVDSPKWDFSRPLTERAGIFIGTREWDTPSRNHAAALLLAASLGGPVTVINEDGRAGRRRLAAIGSSKLEVIDGRLAYPEYLRLIARHRILLQFDRSAVPGQVAGDALLCGVPVVGGDGAIERIAFSATCGYARSGEELREIAARLLRDDAECNAVIAEARGIAVAELSFKVIAAELESYFSALHP